MVAFLFAIRVAASLLLIPFIAGSSLTLRPPFASAHAGEATSVSPVNPSSITVIDILSSSTEHTVLLHLLQRCKLIPTLNLMQGVTFFAPTDSAWQTWANQRILLGGQNDDDAEAVLSQIIIAHPSSELEDLADNVLFKTHQLLLYHMLNYTLPVAKRSQATGTADGRDRWIAKNVSTETTLLFPSRAHHPPSNAPPPHPPWSPLGGTGTLGGQGQKLRLGYDLRESFGPHRVQVDVAGQGGIKVWTEWNGNHTEKGSYGERYRLGSNGLVIGLCGVLETPPDIDGLIKTDRSLSSLEELLSLTPSVSRLVNQSHITLFAPENEAFNKAFDEMERRYLWSDWGSEGRTRILNAHIVSDAQGNGSDHLVGKRAPIVGWRGSVIAHGPVTVTTSLNISLILQVDRDGNMLANSTAISQPDNFASNGVLQRTSSLLLPPHFKLLNSPEKVMLSLNASRFVSLLQQTGLSDVFTSTNRPEEKRTFLVPTDDVLDGTTQWLLSTMDGAKIKDTLEYHILPGLHTPKSLKNGNLLPTELKPKRLGGARQRLRVGLSQEMHEGERDTSRTPSDIRFGDAYVTAEPFFADDYIIYLISSLNEPPEDVIQSAVSDLDLSTFVASIFAASLDKLVRRTSAVTYLAPTNQAFRNLGLASRYLLNPEGKDDLRKILKYQAIDSLLYGMNMSLGTTPLNTLVGESLRLNVSKLDANTTTRQIEGPSRQIANLPVPLSGIRPSNILATDVLTDTGVVHVVDAVQIPSRVHITPGKLLHGAGCSILIELLVKAKMEWLLLGHGPPAQSNLSQEQNTMVVPPYTILAPSNEAFSRINLTYYLHNEAALLSLLNLHIVTSKSSREAQVETATFKARSSFPLSLQDESIFSTLHSLQRYGDVIFRNDGHGSWLVGVNAARGPDQQSNAARVMEAGRATPIWETTEGDWSQLSFDEDGTVWRDGQSLGGGIITIDRVLIPYQPDWFADWGYLAIVMAVGGFGLLALAVYLFLHRSRKEGRVKLEGEEDEDDEVED